MENTHVDLVEWLSGKSKECPKNFPGAGKVDYYKRYEALSDYLNREVHPHVEKLAMSVDGGYLNDHGPEHIKTVIARASALVRDPEHALTPYEVFILLAAIHFHDIGNIYGREEHEARHLEVMNRCSQLLGNDNVEKKLISQIAKAHGGRTKDSISSLPKGEASNSQLIRMQRLAAVLRFADELADDKDRAARFALEIKKLPKSSEVYHQYAYHLHSVIIDSRGGAVDLSFQLSAEAATEKFGKGEDEVFLIDEIFKRTFKMHLERSYCVRFMREVAPIDRINVDIQIWSGDASLKRIQYRLEESGYPDSADEWIYSLCPALTVAGERITGESILSEIKSQLAAA